MALAMGVACGTVLGGTGPCFWRTYDGNLDDRGSLNVPQKGSYIIPAGKVKELSGVTGKATFTPAVCGQGICRYSPWYEHSTGGASAFSIVATFRCAPSPNEIILNLGHMRSPDIESLMLTTDNANRLRLAVVAGVHPKVVRSVFVPVKDVRQFHTYAIVHAADDTVTVYVDGVKTPATLTFKSTNECFQVLGGYNKQRELENFAHGCYNAFNVVDDIRIYDRLLDEAEIKSLNARGTIPAAVAAAQQPIDVAWPVLKHYDQQHIQQVVLPLGGIGCGTIGLKGSGELRDFELFNNPNVSEPGEGLAFAITARGQKTPAASTLLAGPMEDFQVVGAGGTRHQHAGYPRFEEASFDAAFPFGTVHLRDKALPYKVDVRGFSPFIPGDSAASSTPVASLEYVVENVTGEPLEVSVCGFGTALMEGYHEYRESDTLRGLVTCSAAKGTAIGAGSYALVTDATGDITYRTSANGNGWGGAKLDFWDDFVDDGRLTPRECTGKAPMGALCVTKTIPAHAKVSFRFALAWNFPNRYGWCKKPVGNWYSQNYGDGWDAAQKIWPKLPDYARRTAAFVNAFISSDEPEAIKDAALSNLSVLTSQTVFRDKEGRLMGYEGMVDKNGWCKGTTTHVWNYEFATGSLFGDLARSTREIEFKYSTLEDGWMVIRFELPVEKQARDHGWDSRTAADGQMGTVMRAYREWKWSGDTAWLKSLWPKIKLALEFAWKGASQWDANADGLMEGEQHNTFDINFYGPNPLCEFWYLGALRAGEEMAQTMGDAAFAAQCRKLYESGRVLLEKQLFNGEYYRQIVPEDKRDVVYQLGTGCLSDQLLGQMAAHILGLGDLSDRAHAKKTCESIMKYNFKEDFSHHYTNMRIYCAGKDKGLLIASWPQGGRERYPFVYFSEVWTGIEYVAAAEMIYQGMDAEALKIVSSARARHDGRRRNPFNEFECGFHYARSLASWNVHLAWSGFQYDGVKKEMRFTRDGTWFWSTGKAWGTAKVVNGKADIRVIEGSL